MLHRRTAMLLPLATLAGCAGGPFEAQETTLLPPIPTGPPSYAHLTPIRLNVARLEIEPAQPGPAIFAVPPAPIEPVVALAALARDRISALGNSGVAVFRIQTARLERHPAGAGGLFSRPTERLICTLRSRLTVLSDNGEPLAFAEAEVDRDAVMPAATPEIRARSAAQVVLAALDALNVELEYQVRRHLRSVLLEGPAGLAPAPGVAREELPRS